MSATRGPDSLLAGGFVAVRPDHVRLIQWIRSALRSQRWVVLVHPADADQLADSERLLKRNAVEVMQTM